MRGGYQTEIGKYDLIYLSAVDYALADNELVMLLSQLKDLLLPNGQIMMISASFLDESPSEKLIHAAKEIVKCLLLQLRLRSSEIHQFWGWMRTRDEYRSIMHQAGLVFVTDNLFMTRHQKTYYIKGIGVAKE